jgi:hypothetical protein
MNQTLSRIACAALLIAPHAFGARDKTPPKETVVKDETIPPANLPLYVLKNRSKFDNPGDAARIPFWPVGWTKQKQAAIAVAVAAEPKAKFDANSFHLSSIVLSGDKAPSLAVINERPYAEGEFIRMPKGTGAHTPIRVGRINDGNVVLEYETQKILVPLRRKELNQHKDETELLNTDR